MSGGDTSGIPSDDLNKYPSHVPIINLTIYLSETPTKCIDHNCHNNLKVSGQETFQLKLQAELQQGLPVPF